MKEKIEAIALKAAEKVKESKKETELEPMNSYERRIVHTILASVKGIKTESAGFGPDRRVVIQPE